MTSFDVWLENREEVYWQAQNVASRHHYYAQEAGMEPLDISTAKVSDIADYLDKLDDHLPNRSILPSGISPILFATRVKSIFRGNFDQDQDIRRIRKGLY